MKIRILSNREEIPCLMPNEKIVHMAFRPSNKDIFKLVEACPKIEAIQLPPSYRVTVSKSVELFLQMQGISVLEGDVWGHRRDLLEYKTVPAGAFEKLNSLKNSGKSLEYIIHAVSAEYRVSPQVVQYILDKNITA